MKLRPPPDWRVSRVEWTEAWLLRRAYAALLPMLTRRPIRPPRQLPFTVVTFSGLRDLPEQIASLRSLLRFAGRPRRIVVAGDGTHTPAARRLLEAVDPVVEAVDWADLAPSWTPPEVRSYAARYPMGKKIALELALPLDGQTVYLDSDVLFRHPCGAALAELAERDRPSYLLDEEDCYLDRDMLFADIETDCPTNAGFYVLPRPVDWSAGLERFRRKSEPPVFHTEQTVVHLTLQAAGGQALDPQRWVVATDDMPRYGDGFRSSEVLLRHYTSPVRHKFWRAVAWS